MSATAFPATRPTASIDRNCLPHCDVFQENGYTKEEMKLAKETCKILGGDDIKVTATAVRVPVMGGHSEAINVEFEQEFDLDEVRAKLAAAPGIEVVDDRNNRHPMPLSAHEQDAVFVGRIRRDETQPHAEHVGRVRQPPQRRSDKCSADRRALAPHAISGQSFFAISRCGVLMTSRSLRLHPASMASG